MDVAIIIATYGDPCWEALAIERALPTALGQGAYDVLRAHHRKGPIALARNLLAGEMEAEWLCFLDGDDELAPGYLDAMKRAAEQAGDGPVLLTPAVQVIRKTGAKGRPGFFDTGRPLSEDNWLVVGTLIQRDLFMRVGGFSDYEHGFEDWALWYKAEKAGARIVKVPDAIYRYHYNPRSKHKIGWRNRKWQVQRHLEIAAELAAWTP